MPSENSPSKNWVNKSFDSTLLELESFLDQYYYTLTGDKISFSGIDENKLNEMSTECTNKIMFSESSTETVNKHMTSTPVYKENLKQRTLDNMFTGKARSCGTPKKRKAVPPISMLNLGLIPDSDSASDSKTYTELRATSVNTAKMSGVSSDMAVSALVESMNNAFSQQFGNFKTEMKDIVTQYQKQEKALINTLINKVDNFTSLLSKKDEEIQTLNASLETSQARIRFLEGRLIRVEKAVSEISEDNLQQKARSMKESLIFYNLPEAISDRENVDHLLRNFFKNELKMPDDEVQSVSIDRAHRMGKKCNQEETNRGKFYFFQRQIEHIQIHQQPGPFKEIFCERSTTS